MWPICQCAYGKREIAGTRRWARSRRGCGCASVRSTVRPVARCARGASPSRCRPPPRLCPSRPARRCMLLCFSTAHLLLHKTPSTLHCFIRFASKGIVRSTRKRALEKRTCPDRTTGHLSEARDRLAQRKQIRRDVHANAWRVEVEIRKNWLLDY